MAGTLANHSAAAHRPARSLRRRIRAHLIHNLINYLVWSTYLGVGFAVADLNGYLDRGSQFNSLVSAAGAVMLWPLVFIE